MKKVCEKAGVKPFVFDAIRHHVASILADSGKASITQAQKFLRHRRSTTTDNHIKTLDPELKQIAKQNYYINKLTLKIKRKGYVRGYALTTFLNKIAEFSTCQNRLSRCNGGERGIRTLGGSFPPHSLSRRAPSAGSAISPFTANLS
jgi:hypothetical protein